MCAICNVFYRVTVMVLPSYNFYIQQKKISTIHNIIQPKPNVIFKIRSSTLHTRPYLNSYKKYIFFAVENIKFSIIHKLITYRFILFTFIFIKDMKINKNTYVAQGKKK